MKQLHLHLPPHGVTLCFTYADDGDDPHIGAVASLDRYLYLPM